MDTRSPYAAGLFYLGYEEGLRKDVKKHMAEAPERASKIDAIGVVVPHAGYEYSGKVAGSVFASIEPPSTCVVIGPNHSGFGSPVAIESSGSWKTPLGEVPVDKDLAQAMLAAGSFIQVNRDAHRFEHSVEVELPFLQEISGDKLSFVPMTLKGMADVAVYKEVGSAVAEAVAQADGEVLIVASSDFTHYEPQNVAETMDKMAIDQIIALDPEGLLATVFANDISMCGYGPVAVMLFAAKALGAKKAELVLYSTSGDTTLDRSSVVGYGGLVVS